MGIFMKVVAVLGSPRSTGVSSTIAREVLRGAASAGHEIVVFEINKLEFRGCQGCGYCRMNDVYCRMEDGLRGYWKELGSCGALVLSSPNYYANVTGPMITFQNRHYCLTGRDGGSRLKPGVKLVGVFSQGNADPAAYRAQYDGYLGTFLKRGMVPAGTLIHAGSGAFAQNGPLMKKAYETGRAL